MLQDTFTIKELFSKDIERNINGVVQAGQVDDDTKHDELSEYVMTGEIEENMAYFYQNYAKSLDRPTTAVGAWISGFFGSGKSHFLKILSYLLDGQPVYGKKPVDYFFDKTENQTLLDQMKRVADLDTHAILFNIESKTSSSSTHNRLAREEKEMIVEAFLKAFNEHLGYSSTLWIADIERQIADASNLEAFKEAFLEVDGTQWEVSREKVKFKRRSFTEALQRIGVEEETAADLLASANRNFAISSEDFAKLVAAYCDSQGPAYRLTFLVDEIGQYIGDDRRLMLNLQTVVEDLGKTCRGRVWVVVTSQEQIDSVTQIAGYDDFSKIQGRFPTRINLTSSNTDEVIRRRLLEKTDPAADELSSRYDMEEQSLQNLLAFDGNRSVLRSGYSSEEEFVHFYPFIPYQIELLQKVFEKVRTQGEAGKHLAHGERSLLNSIQEVALELKEEGTDRLARFSQFYGTIRRFLDSSIVSTIHRAREREQIEEFDLEVLKVLYMIKGIPEIEATVDNLTTLLIDSVDAIKSDVEKRVRLALQRLEKVILIQKNADQTFTFLSDDEQEIQREVGRTSINDANIDARLGRQFFNQIYSAQRFLYHQTPFDFNKRFNGFVKGTTAHDLTLQVITWDRSEGETRLSANSGTMIMRIPEEQVQTFEEPMKQAERIDNYLRIKNSSGLSSQYQRIFDNLEKQMGEFEDQGYEKLSSACREAVFYIDGQDYTFKGTVEHQLNEAFKKLVENTYSKWGYIEVPVPRDAARETILEWGREGLPPSTTEGTTNQLALDEIRHFMERQTTAKLKELTDHFTRSPYGWTEEDIAGLVAALDQAGKVEITYMGESLEVDHPEYATRLLNRRDREKVGLKAKIGMPPKVRGELTDLLQEVFNRYEPVESYQDGARLLRQLIGNQKQQADEMVALFRQGDPDYPYPDGERIEAVRDRLQALLDTYDAETLVKEAIAAWDEIEDGVELLEHCGSFYKGKGIQLFKQAVALLRKRADDLIVFDEEEGVASAKQGIETILRNPDPYRDIPHLAGLCDRLDQRLQELVEAAAQKVIRQLEEVQAAVEQLGSQYGDHPQAVTRIQEAQSRFQVYKDEIQRAENRSTLSTYREKATQDYHRLQGEITEASGEEIIHVALSDLIPSTGKQLQNETELETFLAELRSQLHASMKQGKIHITR